VIINTVGYNYEYL